MKCEYFEGCEVYRKHGDALCGKLFCRDKCPSGKAVRNDSRKGAKGAKKTLKPDFERF